MFTSLLVGAVILFKNVRKKEELKDNENHEKFDNDYDPDFFSP
jgi:hypothetical protein